MALIDTNGNYLKISEVSVNERNGLIVSYDIYETKQKRLNGIGDFDNTIKSGKSIQDFNTFTNGPTLRDTLYTTGYLNLKQNGFSNWADD